MPLGRAHSPALRPVAVQHHRIAKQSAGGALVQQCTLRVQVVEVPGWHPEVQQQHHRFPEGDPSGPRSAPRFRSHALLVGNIQHKTATDQSCIGCDNGWPKRRAPQEMKCSSVSGAGRRQGRREGRQKRRGIGGHRRSDRGGQGCLRIWPTPRFCGWGGGSTRLLLGSGWGPGCGAMAHGLASLAPTQSPSPPRSSCRGR